MHHHYFAVLGSTPALSLAELNSVLGTSLATPNPHLADLGEHSLESITALAQKLGGVVKILEQVTQLDRPSPDTVLSVLSDTLAQWYQAHPDKKLTFALSQLLHGSSMPITATQLKKQLSSLGLSSRFLTDQSEHQLGHQITAAAWQGQPQLQEFFLVNTGDSHTLMRTIWVQDIASWADRDRHKPYADRRKGMLPPKTARSMLNLLSKSIQDNLETAVIYDPFCGSGTILLEAAMLGYQVLGSDLDPDSVAGTQKNLEWLAQNQPHLAPKLQQVFRHDVGQPLPSNLPQVSAVVTEPFLGKPTPSPAAAANIAKGLGKLYLGAFKRWRQILLPGGEVVIVWPAIEAGSRLVTLEFLIDKLAELGYSTSLGPIEYRRPQAIVRRHIYTFQYRP